MEYIDTVTDRSRRLAHIVIQADELQHRVRQIGREISADHAGRSILLVGVMKDAIFLVADLMRALDVECEMDFVTVASQGSRGVEAGLVRVLKDLDAEIEGRHVVVVATLVGSGLTLGYLTRNLLARRPASLKLCALLSKPDRREVNLTIDYVGFEIPDRRVVGYGLDAEEHFRRLPYVAALEDTEMRHSDSPQSETAR